jgi:lipoprotein-releasing system permease protein
MSVPASRSQPFGPFERTLAWRYLRARREHGGAALVSVISFVGIALAVAALVVVMSLMNGFRSQLLDSLLGGRGHLFVTTSFLTQEDADRLADQLRSVEGVVSVTPIIEGQAFAQSPTDSRGVFVRGVAGDDARALEMVKNDEFEGSAERFGEGEKGGRSIMVARKVARALGVGPDQTITLISPSTTATAMGSVPKRKAYDVDAVFTTGYGDLDEIFVLMPIEQAQIFFNYQGRYQNLELRVTNPQRVEDVTARIAPLVPFGETTSWKEVNSGIVGALNVEFSVMRVIFLILVTITSLNIITGVVMLVKNKTRDVAILRTIGASQGSVLRVFLMVGGFLGVAGTLVGLSIGLALVWQIDAVEAALNFVSGREVFDPEVYGFDGLPAKLNWGEVGFAAIFAMLMSVLVTLAPAWRAARLDPVEALRFE